VHQQHTAIHDRKITAWIPVLIFSEALHGFDAAGGYQLSQAIALGSTWDTTLVEQVLQRRRKKAVRKERDKSCRRARFWRATPLGKNEECIARSVLVSRIGMAAVFGLQGREKMLGDDHRRRYPETFAGHGATRRGKNIAPVISRAELSANASLPVRNRGQTRQRSIDHGNPTTNGTAVPTTSSQMC